MQLLPGGVTMYQSNINNIEAIRQIDKIVQTPKVSLQSTQSNKTTDQSEALLDSEIFKKLDFSEIVEEASKGLEVVNTELSFRVHEGTGRPVIQLIESGTDRVVREIPPEKMLDIVAGIWDWAGLIIDRSE